MARSVEMLLAGAVGAGPEELAKLDLGEAGIGPRGPWVSSQGENAAQARSRRASS